MEKKYVYAIDAAVLVGTLAVIFIFYSIIFSPSVTLSPDISLQKSSILFSFEDNGVSNFLIGNKPDLSDAKSYLVFDGLKVDLQSGIYYFKVEGVLESFSQKLTAQDSISLEFVKQGSSYYVVNAGGENLDVRKINENGKVYDAFSFTSNAVQGGKNG